MKKNKTKKGFTLVELVIVMAVISLILSIVIPNFRAMQIEGEITKVEGDLQTLKVAIASYWRHNSQEFPANIHSALTGTSPAIISSVLADPFNTDGTNKTYGYISGTDGTFGDYFIVYTKGPGADTVPAWSAGDQEVQYTGSGRVATNAPLAKQ